MVVGDPSIPAIRILSRRRRRIENMFASLKDRRGASTPYTADALTPSYPAIAFAVIFVFIFWTNGP